MVTEQELWQRERDETDRELQKVSRLIADLGEKFCCFPADTPFASMADLLMDRFGMATVAARVRSLRDGRSLELEVFAYSVQEAYVAEVKTRLREDGLAELLRTLQKFREFFPEHAGKQLYGVLAAVDIPADMAEKTLREGIYLARIQDDELEIQVPEGFQPRAY